jgi:aspartyl-tRNA(Asn)/glutamyl-tRNA(Gln) amidotransferase subunit A
MTNKQTIHELKESLAKKEISSTELTQEYLAELHRNNNELNAFLYITSERALAMAAQVDQKISKGEQVSAIAGIPTSLKDNYNWTGTPTTAASKILEKYISPYNATVTQRLLDADAVVLGKTNMDAFAHGSSTETSDFGVTLNPHNHERVAGGSSGGAAAAVAANMGVYAIGSETAGSVRGPAAWCGIYGFAPTYGRFSRYGVVAMGSSLDRPGILANSTMDCAIVADILSGKDPKDATTIPEGKTSYTKNLDPKIKKGLKIGIPKGFFDEKINKEVREKVMDAVKKLEKAGAKIVDIDTYDPRLAIVVYTIICRSEVSSNLARIDGIRYGHFSKERAEDILDQIAINRGEGFGNEAKQRSMTGAYALSVGYYDAYYKKAQQVRTLIIEHFKQLLTTEVDLIVGPTMPTVAPKLGVTAGDPLFGETADMLTEPSALAGLPCISVPVGKDKAGLPIGMQIFGPQFAEQEVLNLAYAYEELSK